MVCQPRGSSLNRMVPQGLPLYSKHAFQERMIQIDTSAQPAGELRTHSCFPQPEEES